MDKKLEIIKKPVEKIGGGIKKEAWFAVTESLATVILGVFLIAWPNIAIKVISYVIGGFFVVRGCYQIINYFISNGYRNYYNNNLLTGVISTLVGAAVLVMGEEISNVFRIVMGVLMIYEALVRINTAIKMSSAKVLSWKWILILSIVMLLLGVFVTFYDGAAMILVGWIMVIIGLMGVFSDIMFIMHVDELMKKIDNFIDNTAI